MSPSNPFAVEAEAKFREAMRLHQNGQIERARQLYEDVLKLQPRHAEALHCLGLMAAQSADFNNAAVLFGKAAAVDIHNAGYHFNHGVALQALGRCDEALAIYEKALQLKPDYLDAECARASALYMLKRYDETIASCDRALKLDPQNPDIHITRGHALYDLKRFEHALMAYERALALNPAHAEAANSRGNALQALHRYDAAIHAYDRALALRPDFAEAHYNRGNALLALRRVGEAIAGYNRALALKPAYADAHCNIGNALLAQRQFDAAIVNYDRSLALAPHNAEVHSNRGVALRELKRFDEALKSFERARALQPNLDFLLGSYLHTKLELCAWDDLDPLRTEIAAGISQGKRVTPPFMALALFDDPALHRAAAKIWVEAKNLNARCSTLPLHAPGNRIRVGYYSADFHDHATLYLMAEMLETHDRERFELYGFSFGPDASGDMRTRVLPVFEKFIDVRAMSDREVAALSNNLGIDIAVDLKGFTGDGRPGLFAERSAPIQVNFLGYPGTLAADCIDYVIADEIVVSRQAQAEFTEHIVVLPHSYQPNDSKRKISDRVFARDELGLPQDNFVFCCLNNNYKISPEAFDGWMRILTAADKSVLWLMEGSKQAALNLRAEAEARGIDGARLVFAKRMPQAEHLARLRLADLFLDTLPYNAHTTASDALWAGLPVLTLAGRSFAGRVAASLLSALDVTDLIADSQEEYEAKAIAMAHNCEALAETKARLARNRTNSTLFDGRAFARAIEAAYEAMYARHRAGLAPERIEIRDNG